MTPKRKLTKDQTEAFQDIDTALGGIVKITTGLSYKRQVRVKNGRGSFSIDITPKDFKKDLMPFVDGLNSLRDILFDVSCQEAKLDTGRKKLIFHIHLPCDKAMARSFRSTHTKLVQKTNKKIFDNALRVLEDTIKTINESLDTLPKAARPKAGKDIYSAGNVRKAKDAIEQIIVEHLKIA
jgi:hypothetical protein